MLLHGRKTGRRNVHFLAFAFKTLRLLRLRLSYPEADPGIEGLYVNDLIITCSPARPGMEWKKQYRDWAEAKEGGDFTQVPQRAAAF